MTTAQLNAILASLHEQSDVDQLRAMIAALKRLRDAEVDTSRKAQYQAIIDAMTQLIIDLGGTP